MTKNERSHTRILFQENNMEQGDGGEERSCRSCAALRLYIPVWGVMGYNLIPRHLKAK